MYIKELDVEVENGTMEFQVKSKLYNINPLDMQKRVRVYVNQLLPEIVNGAHSIDEIVFSIEVLKRHFTRFTKALYKHNASSYYHDVVYVTVKAYNELYKKYWDVKEDVE